MSDGPLAVALMTMGRFYCSIPAAWVDWGTKMELALVEITA